MLKYEVQWDENVNNVFLMLEYNGNVLPKMLVM
jgi:hypothetical protein